MPPLRRAATVLSVLLLCPTTAVLAPGVAAADPPRTTISLTFDDGTADQLEAAASLQANGLTATYFVNSGFVDSPGFLTRDDLHALVADGNEIGGHTVNHPDLTMLAGDELRRQICNDRATLTGWGFTVTNFAYPCATATAATEAAAHGGGYTSARGLGDVETRFGCPGCPVAEDVPPETPYYTKALAEVDRTWTLADLQVPVTTAETSGGGWVQYTFHRVCDGCDELSISRSLFDEFAGWLATREASHGTVVRTVNQVLTGPARPVVPGPVAAPAGPGINGLKNPSLEAAGPACWSEAGYGINTPTFTTTTNAHSGAAAVQLTVTGHRSGDARLLPTMDLGECAPAVVPGRTYSLRTWYSSTRVVQFAVYYRTAVGSWVYWTAGPWFPASAAYTQAVWAPPEVPAGATALSFGLSLFGNGTLTVDDAALYDAESAPSVAA